MYRPSACSNWQVGGGENASNSLPANLLVPMPPARGKLQLAVYKPVDLITFCAQRCCRNPWHERGMATVPLIAPSIQKRANSSRLPALSTLTACKNSSAAMPRTKAFPQLHLRHRCRPAFSPLGRRSSYPFVGKEPGKLRTANRLAGSLAV